MTSSVRGSPAGRPSMMTVSALPCDSPAVRKRSALIAAAAPAGCRAPALRRFRGARHGGARRRAPAEGVTDLGGRPLLPVHLAGELAMDVRRQDAGPLGHSGGIAERSVDVD